MPQPQSRELLMASELVTHCDRPPRPSDSCHRYEISLEASEPGWADLSRLQLLAVDQDPEDATPADVLPWTTVEAIRVHNTRELIRGQGYTLGAPAGPFSPFRQYGPIQLGRWWLEGGNLITIRLCTEMPPHDDDGDWKPALAYSAAVPFLPDNPRNYECPHDLSDRDRAYVASQAYEVSCHGEEANATTLELKFDQDGIVDLDTLQVQVRHREPTDYGTPPVATAIVESIELPTRQELIVGGSYGGESNLAAPAGIFASLGRRFDWVRFGKLDVSTRNTLRVRVRQLTTGHESPPAESTLSAGVQFYPSKKRTH